jgi:hypothetical protein
LRIVRLVATDEEQPVALRARASYLSGNLEFLREEYEPAVEAYDSTLKLIPGLEDEKADGVGRDAAWNRAIALRRIEERKKDPPDAGPDAKPPPNDGGDDDKGDSGDDRHGDGGSKEPPQKDGGAPQSGKDGGGQDEPDEPDQQNQHDGGAQNEPSSSESPQSSPPNSDQTPPPPSLSQDERMLDQLEQAPTVQQEAARRQSGRVLRGMEDK